MCKKYVCLTFLVLLGVIGSAFAADVQWDNSGGDRLWRTATNWDLNRVPTTADKAAIRNAAVLGPIIDSSTTAQAAYVVIGDWSSSSDTLDITGGSLTVSGWFVIGYSTANNGTLTMSGGVINAGSTFYVGNSGKGTINITGGTINIAGAFGIAQLAGGSGDVFLDGGTISCASFSMTSTGAMDITSGTLKVNGDATSAINSYISSGWITAYGGSGTLNVDYNVSNPGQTTVTANTAEKAAYPSPANGATGISINADLSWVAGQYATSHDVYFGTDSTPDSTEFQGNQAGVTFDPGTLTLGVTYYWRIDEVNPGNPSSPWIGDVWSFTTQTGTAVLRKGPYLIYPGDNTQMTVLWQLDASETCAIVWGLDTNYSSGSANVPEYGTDHQYKYNITGLTPGSKYYYKVTVGSGITTGTFYAAPAASATSLKFLMYGDTRTNGISNNSVCGGMVSAYTSDPAYQTIVLHAGDWVSADGETEWTTQWYNYGWTNIVNATASMPFMGAIGNHEGNGSCPVFDKYRPFPFVAAPAEYFSFDYGPLHVAVVDQYTTYTSGAQYDWLVNDLSSSTKQWKIIVLHQPGWSCRGGHNNDTNVQNYIQPLCEQYGVQIVLAGHNHYYSRALVNGVHHLTSGGGGADLYTPVDGEPSIVSYLKTLNFQKVEIVGDTMNYQSLQPDGTVIDSFQINLTPPPMPGKATNPSPANSATDVAVNADLSWVAGADATSHDVYFGTDSTPDATEFQGNQGSTSFDPGALANSTTYYWRIDENNASGTTTGDVWSFTTVAAGGPVNDAATGEIPVIGTVSGSYADTQSSNNGYESITEVVSGGKPNSRYSYLEHKWTINVTGGSTVTFYVEAHHSSNSEGDNFVFAYSTNDSTYTNMLTVTKTSDDNTYQSYALPSSTSGTVYIRVVDADHTAGRQNLDTVYVDHMYIRSETVSEPPAQASNPSPANGANGVSTTADLGWTAGSGATSHDVYFGTSSPGVFMGNQSGTTFDPGTMADSTLYYWRINEKNDYGTTTGVVWNFTTGAGCSPSTTHVESIVCGTAAGSPPNLYGQVTVTVYNNCGEPVSGADVTGTFTGSFNEQLMATTNSSGIAVITTTTQAKKPAYTFCVDSIVHSTLSYNSAENVETCDSY